MSEDGQWVGCKEGTFAKSICIPGKQETDCRLELELELEPEGDGAIERRTNMPLTA